MRQPPAMQWICARGVLAAAQSAAAAFEREHGLAVALRDLDEGAAQLEASVACETRPELMVEVACRKPGEGLLK